MAALRRKTHDDLDERIKRPTRTTELGLLILSSIIVTAMYVLASLGAKGQLPPRLWYFLGVVLGLSLVLHIFLRQNAPFSSQVLLPMASLLNGIGFVEIARWNPAYAEKQAVWIAVSAVVLIVVLLVVRRIRDIDRYRYLTLFGAIFLMLSPLIPHVGQNIHGARLWVGWGSHTLFQPVEIAKILLAIFFASYFAANRDMLSISTVRIAGRGLINFRVLFPILAAWGFAILVLGVENDIGFAMILFALFISMIWVATGRLGYVGAGALLFATGGYFGLHFFHQVHQRISVWLNPWMLSTWRNGGNQIGEGWFAIAAGGLTGTGLGLGRSGDIPYLTSDMIFAAIAEELGLIGVVVIMSCFIMFVAEGIRIAQRCHSDFARLTALALSLIIGFQAFFIVAGVLRILPFTGITLPFMAYGGSSLIANYAIVALLLRISDENGREIVGGEVHDIAIGDRTIKEERRRKGSVRPLLGETPR